MLYCIVDLNHQEAFTSGQPQQPPPTRKKITRSKSEYPGQADDKLDTAARPLPTSPTKTPGKGRRPPPPLPPPIPDVQEEEKPAKGNSM